MKTQDLKMLSYMVCSLATILCIYLWIQDRSVFLDEANLIINIHDLSFLELLGELKGDQRAPFLFTWIAKTITLLFGDSTISYRLLPLVLVISSIWIFNSIALSNFTNFIGLAISIMFCSNDLILRYATECKQYSADILSFTLLIYMWQMYPPNSKHILKWLLIGSLLMWLSMPSILILVSIGLSWLVVSYHNDFKNIKPILCIGGGWLVCLCINYYFILAPGMESKFMQNYHTPYFLDISQFDSIQRSFMVFIRLISKKTTLGITTVSLLILIGAFTLVKNRSIKAIVLLTPLVLVLVLSSIGKYSLLERLVLFSLPLLLILVGHGAFHLSKTINNKYLRRSILVLLGITMLITMKYRNGLKWVTTTPTEDIKTVLLSIYNTKDKPHIYLSKHAYPSYYHYKNIDTCIDGGTHDRGSQESAIFHEFEPLKTDTSWILLSHVLDLESETEKIQMKYKIIRDIRAKGTVALQVVR